LKPEKGRSRILHAFILASLFGMLVFVVQSLAVIGSLDVAWPDEMAWIFDIARLFLLDFSGFTLACWTGNGFVGRYVSTLLAPVFLLLFTSVAFVAGRLHERFAMSIPTTVSFLGTLLTALYVTLVKHVMTYFECGANPGEGTPDTLVHYRDIECGSSEQSAAVVPMALGMLVYCVGFYILNAYLAFVAPEQWDNVKFREYARFLVNRWRPDYWWWGIAVLTRNVLVASSGLLGDDVRVQLLVVMMCVVVYSVLVGIFQPWVVPVLNSFEIVGTLLLGLLCAVGLIFNSSEQARSILLQLEEAWAKDEVATIEADMRTFGVFFCVVLAIFLFLMAGLVVWCMSSLVGWTNKVADQHEKQTALFSKMAQAIQSSEFLVLIEAVVKHGTDYDRERMEEMLRKIAAVAFTVPGKVEDAFIRPPAGKHAAELQKSLQPSSSEGVVQVVSA